jgi:hypothetical protein
VAAPQETCCPTRTFGLASEHGAEPGNFRRDFARLAGLRSQLLT